MTGQPRGHMMNHIESLLAEYYDWQGYVVKCNTRVGRLPRGGWEMELDIVAFDPRSRRIFHVEPSLAGDTWSKREVRYKKKFEAGRKYICKNLFPWAEASTPITQLAILPNCGPKYRKLAAGDVITIDEMMSEIKQAVKRVGRAGRAAIPERYPLLRTIQFTVSGLCPLKDMGSAAIRLTAPDEAASAQPVDAGIPVT